MHVLNLVEIGRDRSEAVNEVKQTVVIIARLVGVDDGDRSFRPAGACRADCLSYHLQRGPAVGTAHVRQGEGTYQVRLWQAVNRLEDKRRRAIDDIFGTLGDG